MLRKVTNFTKYAFGAKQLKKAFFQFLNLQAGAVYRGAPEFKQRKYINIQITDKFKEMQQKRKQQRLMYAQRRKKLLEQKLSNESKLLTEYEKVELQKIKQQMKSLKNIIEEQDKQLAEIQKKLEQTQADFILVQGPKKLIVLNSITYLKHINGLPSGVRLTPQSIKVVQNVHYLVTHNLPVQRYKLYELMPELFVQQIGQLEESVQKLIMQKNLNIFEEVTSHPLRQFARNLRVRDSTQYQLIKLTQQKSSLHINMCLQATQMMKAHTLYIEKVAKGQTPFRNIQHCITALTSSKLKLQLSEEQQAFKKTCLQIMDNLQKWKSYAKDYHEKIIQIKYSYIQPPIYVKNHPKLYQLWDKYMQTHTNPILLQDLPNYLPKLPHNDDGRAFMEEKLRKQVQKYDEQFVKLFNQDKQKLMLKKKQTQIEFYKFSTKILQQYQALEDKSASQQQFKKLPKQPKKKQQNYSRITLDQLTKMIYLNNKNHKKYNLDFFAKYFAMQDPQIKKDLFNMLNSISYLHILTPEEEGQPEAKKQIKQTVLKFIH